MSPPTSTPGTFFNVRDPATLPLTTTLLDSTPVPQPSLINCTPALILSSTSVALAFSEQNNVNKSALGKRLFIFFPLQDPWVCVLRSSLSARKTRHAIDVRIEAIS